MGLHVIRKGLNLPIAGEPAQTVGVAKQPKRVALLAADSVGLKPTMLVKAGDWVLRGQALFEDKRYPGLRYTSPGAGTVSEIHRGEKRAFLSIVIDLSEAELSGRGADEHAGFNSFTSKDAPGLGREEIRALLLESGLWTAFRTRPFSKVPPPDSQPRSIFVTAMDTNPLAPSVDEIVRGRTDDFERGLLCVAKLTDGKVFLCKAPGTAIASSPHNGVTVEEFSGKHPAGSAGVHIHMLDPVARDKTVWHIGLQDVIAIGSLVRTGKIDVERIVALAGPSVKQPRLIRTRLGASTDDLTRDELKPGEARVVSGSCLSGRSASGAVSGYLGRYHQQITCLPEGRNREFLGWLMPGAGKFSTIPVYLSAFADHGRKYTFTTDTNGSPRAMVPIGMYERVMPMDIQPTFLLRALIMNDVERAEQLGCLELDEEDLALCTFVCPGKYEYGPILRRVLDQIDKEG
jgi:Na+-transporting NADH:ubiquinone oxidoreductase subunit A